MNERQQKIWDYLEAHAVGKSNAVKIINLADDLGIISKGSNSDNVRPIITNMVKEHKLPIGTCDAGIFIFTNEKEKEEAARFVERETKADAIRTIPPYSK